MIFLERREARDVCGMRMVNWLNCNNGWNNVEVWMSVGVVSARSFYRCITYLARMDFKFAGRSNNYGNCKS